MLRANEEAGPDPALPPLEQLSWLIWPADGLEELLEGGAFRFLDVESSATCETSDRGTVTRTLTVKLNDVQLLRRVATRAQPADADLIAASLVPSGSALLIRSLPCSRSPGSRGDRCPSSSSMYPRDRPPGPVDGLA